MLIHCRLFTLAFLLFVDSFAPWRTETFSINSTFCLWIIKRVENSALNIGKTFCVIRWSGNSAFNVRRLFKSFEMHRLHIRALCCDYRRHSSLRWITPWFKNRYPSRNSMRSSNVHVAVRAQFLMVSCFLFECWRKTIIGYLFRDKFTMVTFQYFWPARSW